MWDYLNKIPKHRVGWVILAYLAVCWGLAGLAAVQLSSKRNALSEYVPVNLCACWCAVEVRNEACTLGHARDVYHKITR